MNLYVDSSVLLRIVFVQAGRLREWTKARRWVSSELLRVEALRTADRVRLREDWPDSLVATTNERILEHLGHFELVRVGRAVLRRASEAFPTPLGTLDAVHLATALLAREEVPDLVVATHDRELAIAARSAGFQVVGLADLP